MLCYSPLTLSNIVMCMVSLVLLTEKIITPAHVWVVIVF